MKYPLMYLGMMYITSCADAVSDYGDKYTWGQRAINAVLWPLTLTSWFCSQNIKLHRLLNILWCVLIAGWLIALMADRL
jgi:hypothetical protein